jgi:hypothetical protein
VWLDPIDLEIALDTGDHPEVRASGMTDGILVEAVNDGLLRACRLADGRIAFTRPLGDLPEVGEPVRVVNPDTGQEVFARHREVTRIAARHGTPADTVWVSVVPSYRSGFAYDLATYPSHWVLAP